MTDEVLAKALQRKKELAEELREIDAFIAVYNRLSDGKPERIETANPLPSVATRSLSTPGRSRRKATPNEIAKATAALIREEGRPFTRSELVSELEARGLIIESKDKPRYIGTILWRQNQFTNLEGYGYWLRDRPYPQAGYDPEAIVQLAERINAEGGFNDLLGDKDPNVFE